MNDEQNHHDWEGKRTILEYTPSKIFRPKWYNTIASDYRTLAQELVIRPWQLQATTWLTWRRLNNVSQHGRYDLE